MQKRKIAPVYGFKALLDEGPGVFEAVVAVFGNVDLIGDRILPGAFGKSLARWAGSGDPIPVIFSHRWDDLDAHVGSVLEAKELLPGAAEIAGTPIADLGGLWIKGRLDVDDPDEPFARRLWKRMEARRIKEFSFAYDVGEERRAADGANDLVEIDVIEVGPTLKGMNPATELLAVKARSIAEKILEAKADDVDALEEIIRGEAKATPPHAFVPGDEDADRCFVCNMTRNTSSHLHTLSAGSDGSKAIVDLAGSVEERQGRLLAAGFEILPLDEANGGLYELALEGTFEDRVVFRLEGWNDPIGGGRYFECSIDEDGDAVALGEPVEVVVEGVTRPKARRSTKTLVDVATVSGEGDRTGKSSGKAEDPERGKAEDLETRTGSGSSGEAARLLVELEDLELS